MTVISIHNVERDAGGNRCPSRFRGDMLSSSRLVHRSKRRQQPEFGKIDAEQKARALAHERSECACALASIFWKSDRFDLVSIGIDDEGAEIGCHRSFAFAWRAFVPGAQFQCPGMKGLHRRGIGRAQANMRARIVDRHVPRPAVEPKFGVLLSKPDRSASRDETAEPDGLKNGIVEFACRSQIAHRNRNMIDHQCNHARCPGDEEAWNARERPRRCCNAHVFRHCERSEAIQGEQAQSLRPLDCFVATLLAMTEDVSVAEIIL